MTRYPFRTSLALIVAFTLAMPPAFAAKKPESAAVTYTTSATGSKKPVVRTAAVKPGQRIYTDSKTRADVRLGRHVLVRLKENSVLWVRKLDFDRKKIAAHVKLAAGKALVKVRKLGPKSKFAISTPVAVASVRGTMFVVEAESKESHIEVLEGIVAVSEFEGELPGGEAVEIDAVEVVAGNEVEVTETAVSEPNVLEAADTQEAAVWSAEPEIQAPEMPMQEMEGFGPEMNDPTSPVEGDMPEGVPEMPEAPLDEIIQPEFSEPETNLEPGENEPEPDLREPAPPQDPNDPPLDPPPDEPPGGTTNPPDPPTLP